ncbi:AraC family transcriptional regulator [Nocardioides sp. Bht2]|uniref:AraC family transcriptional regulator n=1 Tax=Nocardioides sp. Bht2 TaxID=3392297 RepID=UPI0039B6D206
MPIHPESTVRAVVDRLTPLLERFRVRTRLFHSGPLCGVTEFPAEIGRGFLHVLRRGELEMTVIHDVGAAERIEVTRPSLLFFPRPIRHTFFNPPADHSDFACATLDFEGGATHPIVRTLPPVVVIALADVPTLEVALELLFAEVDSDRCGHPIVVDRVFEVVLIQMLRWMIDHSAELALPPGLLPALADERLAPALVALHHEPGRPWRLDTMAREANLSRSAFAARFKEVVGRTPADYLTEWRLTIAQAQLRAGASVSLVAADLGYASPSSFTRVFTQRIGVSPRAWSASAG